MTSYTAAPECKVVSAEVSDVTTDIGAQAAKALPPGRRYRYARDVKYTLDNGEVVASRITGQTKPRLQERIADIRNNIMLGCMLATQYDHGDGPYWSLSTRYYIGPR